ncbi:hypothetical protein J4E93_001294 [Alternaria ventricosa]|uniref:uncharacterized protein n=1 Tax=Alternaria ventricosa TaxID=1187951 RepID=UPI0020C4F1ED|nr:uncharacterized protein J4E93_001294 [Alternaria ventricosa]KAI4653528.1 hypothetical protein J4E93_001294 [Alternaria ventricosa]
MKFSIGLAVALTASVGASSRIKRQFGYPDVEDCGLDAFDGHTTPTGTPSCGIVAYVKTTPAYYFESSGTKNTFQACSALCKADSKCLSFGYGEANCMLFDVTAIDNTNYNPMSPYTFYDAACPAELPVRKRQLDISLGGPGGIHISLGLGSGEISSACSCFITRGPASTTVTRTVSSAVVRTSTVISTVTRTRAAGAE